MEFTYSAYCGLLNMLHSHRYQIADYDNYQTFSRPVILRHDIDNSTQMAAKLSDIEKEAGVHSTFFVLLATDFYNVFTVENRANLSRILNNGSKLGLHFDEKQYEQQLAPFIQKEDWNGYCSNISRLILNEAQALSAAVGCPITSVSMHRPSAFLLEQNLQIDGMINAYSNVFFHEFKYLSDSRCHWREPAERIIEEEQYERINILTHAFWYHPQAVSMHDTISDFIHSASKECYKHFSENFRDLEEVMTLDELEEHK